MMNSQYQRRYLRAPYREDIIYSDGDNVLKASTLNISEEGMLLDFLPSFPSQDDVSLIFPLCIFPLMKDMSIYRLQTFSRDQLDVHVIRASAKMVRREQLSQDLENIFKSRFGLNFLSIGPESREKIEQYVAHFSSNLVYLQTLVDSFNSDEETKTKTRALAKILGYKSSDKIAKLRMEITQDYKSLQWL
jgi:hypothetical protein